MATSQTSCAGTCKGSAPLQGLAYNGCVTYAGGANSLRYLEDVTRVGGGHVHLTIGSALDIFGGTGVRYEDCVSFNRTSR